MDSKIKIQEKLLSGIIKFYKEPKYYHKISILLNISNFDKRFHKIINNLIENNFIELSLYKNFNYDNDITIEQYDFYLSSLKEILEKERTEKAKSKMKNAKDFNELQNILVAETTSLLSENKSIDNMKISSVLEENIDFLQSYKGKETLGSPIGLKPLDEVVEGIFGLVALTGVPGGGKTTLALQTADNTAFIEKKPVLYITLEVPKKMFVSKMISFKTGIPVKILMKENLNNEQSIKYYTAINEILDNNTFYVMDKEDGVTFLNIYEKIKQIKENYYKEFGKESEVLVVLDYLNLFNDYGTNEKGLDINQKIANQMAKFVEIKNKTGDNFLLIAAKNKQGYKTSDLASIKGPNDLEYSFETIISLEKPDKMDEELLDDVNVYATIMKSRWGEAFVEVPLRFEGKASRFFTIEEIPEEYKSANKEIE